MSETKSKKPKKTRTRQRSTNKVDYINEHELALMLSIGRNCRKFGEPVRELTQVSRQEFDKNYQEYQVLIEEGRDKRDSKVQECFKNALWHSQFAEPTEDEIARVYELLVLLSRRCIHTFSRNSHLTEDELGSLAFERWIRYRENFNPLRKSEITDNRVNAFAYMTQVIKNIIYEEFNKVNKETSSEILPPGVLHSIEDTSEFSELEECRDMLIKESLRCTNLETCLKNIAKKYEMDPSVIIKTITVFSLLPQIEQNILENVWDF